MDEHLILPVAARRLGVGVKELYEAVKRGDVPSQMVNGRHVIPLSYFQPRSYMDQAMGGYYGYS